MGHKGNFLTSEDKAELESINFEIVENNLISYPSYFDSVHSMIDYCKLLFGLDQASDDQIEK